MKKSISEDEKTKKKDKTKKVEPSTTIKKKSPAVTRKKKKQIDTKELALIISEFQKYYLSKLMPKIQSFAAQNVDHSFTKASLEVLFVDMFSSLKKDAFITDDKFNQYTMPTKIIATKEVEKITEQKGFFAKIFGFKGQEIITKVQEEFIENGPSQFKQDVREFIVFDRYVHKEQPHITLESKLNFNFTVMLSKLGYNGLADELLIVLNKEDMQALKTLNLNFQKNKDLLYKEFLPPELASNEPIVKADNTPSGNVNKHQERNNT